MHNQTTHSQNYDYMKKILDLFPNLKNVDPLLKEEFANNAILQTFPTKKILYKHGDKCNFLTLVISGTVRVYKVGENKNEITLYRVGKGECCFLTASAIMQDFQFPAIAIVEEQIEVAMIPATILQEWLKRNEIWRNYLFSLLSSRLSNVASTVDQVTFQKIDQRLTDLLLRENKDNFIKMTHLEMASELGTAREVISRALKEFEKEGIIKTERGRIEITNIESLQKKQNR